MRHLSSSLSQILSDKETLHLTQRKIKLSFAVDKTIFKKVVLGDFKEKAVPFGTVSLSSSSNSFMKVTNQSATTQMFPEQQTVTFYI